MFFFQLKNRVNNTIKLVLQTQISYNNILCSIVVNLIYVIVSIKAEGPQKKPQIGLSSLCNLKKKGGRGDDQMGITIKFVLNLILYN